MCVLGLGFNSRMVHFFSSTNDIIKSLQLLFCIDLYYYFYYSSIGCWEFQVESTWNPHGITREDGGGVVVVVGDVARERMVAVSPSSLVTWDVRGWQWCRRRRW